MNQNPATAPAQSAPQTQYGEAGIPNFLHIPARNPAALEAYLHLYVDKLVRSELEQDTGRRSA